MWISQLFSDEYLASVVLRAFTVGVLVSLCAALLGVILVLKRFSMIGDGLSHVGFGALALATALGVGGAYALEFSLPLVAVCSFALLWLTGKGKLKGDTAIGIISSAAMAGGVILYHLNGGMTADACNSLFGSASVLTLTEKDSVISIALSVTVIGLFLLFYRRIFAITFDETFATACIGGVGGFRILLSLLTSVTVVVGMKMMGAVMISAMIIFPGVTARKLCKSFQGVVTVSAALSVVCYLVGFVAACLWGLPTGPCVVVANLAVYLLCSLKASLT